MIAGSLDAAVEAVWVDSFPRYETPREGGVHELANLHIVFDADRDPAGVIVDLTRANAGELRSLEVLAGEDLFRRVPGVALVHEEAQRRCARRLGLTASLRVDGVATSADMDHASELCRMLAAAPAWPLPRA